MLQILAEDSLVPILGIYNTETNRSNLSQEGAFIAIDLDSRNKTGDLKLIIMNNETVNEKNVCNILHNFIYQDLYISDLK